MIKYTPLFQSFFAVPLLLLVALFQLPRQHLYLLLETVDAGAQEHDLLVLAECFGQQHSGLLAYAMDWLGQLGEYCVRPLVNQVRLLLEVSLLNLCDEAGIQITSFARG